MVYEKHGVQSAKREMMNEKAVFPGSGQGSRPCQHKTDSLLLPKLNLTINILAVASC